MNDRRGVLVVAGLIVLALLGHGLFDHDLWTPDEPREGELGRAMATSQDYLVPRLGDEPFLEKPPGYYVLLAMLIRLSGSQSAGVLRLPSAIAVLLTAVLTFFIGRRFLGARIAFVGLLFFVTFESSFELAHRVTLDPLLMLATTLAMFGYLRAVDGERSFTALPFWLGMVVAFLLKGVVGPALVGVAALAIALVERRFAFVRELRPITGGLVFVMVVAALCWMFYRRNPGHLHEFVLHNQVMRFLGGQGYGGGHEEPIYGYLLSLPVAWLPWTVAVVAALAPAHRSSPARPLLIWPAAMLILLSLAATKRAVYAAPVLPALGLLVAQAFDSTTALSARLRGLLERFHVTLLMLVIIMVPLAVVLLLDGPPAYLLVGVGLTMTLIILWRRQRRHLSAGVVVCVLAAVAYHEAIAMGFARLNQHKSLRPVAQQIAASVPDQTRLFGYRLDETMRAALPFYAAVSPRNQDDIDQLNEQLAEPEPRWILTLERHLEAAWPKLEYPYDILLRFDLSPRRVVLLIGNDGAHRNH